MPARASTRGRTRPLTRFRSSRRSPPSGGRSATKRLRFARPSASAHRTATTTRLQFVLPPRLEALLPQVVRRGASVSARALSRDDRDPPRDSDREGGDVRRAPARRAPSQAPRSVRGLAALPPRARDAGRRSLLHRGRRPPLQLARRRGGRVRRDVHPSRRERDRTRSHHSLLRHRAADEVRLGDRAQPLRRAPASLRRPRRRTPKPTARAC